MRLWLVRTGEEGFALTDCVKAGVVALRYAFVPDATHLGVDEIAEGVREAGTRSDLVGVARMLHSFVHDVERGDVVVSTHAADRAIYFGEVTGDYRFDDESPVPGFRHLRDVAWWGSLSRDLGIAADRLREIDRPPTLYEITDCSYWLERAEQAKLEPLRPPSRAKRPTRTPRDVEVATATCTACFQKKPATIIEDGVCSDCR